MVVSVWRLVKHIFQYIVCCVVVVWPMHGVIVEFPVIRNSTHPSLHTVKWGVASFYGITHNCWTALEAEFVNISVSLTCNMVCGQCFRRCKASFAAFTRTIYLMPSCIRGEPY
jgi:hypothetical protein